MNNFKQMNDGEFIGFYSNLVFKETTFQPARISVIRKIIGPCGHLSDMQIGDDVIDETFKGDDKAFDNAFNKAYDEMMVLFIRSKLETFEQSVYAAINLAKEFNANEHGQILDELVIRFYNIDIVYIDALINACKNVIGNNNETL